MRSSYQVFQSIETMMKKTWMRLRKKGFAANKRSNRPSSLSQERLSSLAQGLLDDSSGVEPDFLEMGRNLMKTHEEASALGLYAREAVLLVNGDEGLLGRIDRLVHDSLAELQSCRDKVCRDSKRFANGAELMGDLCKLCLVFDKMVLELETIGFNIGIESVRTDEGRDLFGQLALDMRNLSKKIDEIAESILGDARSNGIIQDKAYREISGDISRMTALTADAEKAAQETVGDIKDLVTLSASTMNEVGRHSREISDRVGKVVEGIQFHDNMHQRISHITQALTEIASAIAEDGDETSHFHAAMAIQTAQLKQLLRELAGIRAMTTDAFDEIVRCLKDLACSVSTFGVGEVAEPSDGGLHDAKRRFSKLGVVIERFNRILEQGIRIHGQMMETFGHAASSAKKLSDATEQVRQINFEIHLMALNAIVRTAHLGSGGQALEVLANAAKDLSGRSSVVVSQVDNLLSDIIAAGTGHSLDIDTDKMNEILGKGSDVDIQGAHERLDSACADITTRAEALMQSVSGIRGRLSFLGDLEDRLNGRLLELESYVTSMQPPAGMAETAEISDTDRFKSRYTMEQERIIHESQTAQAVPLELAESLDVPADEAAGEISPPSSAPENPSDIASTEGELGDNVELF